METWLTDKQFDIEVSRLLDCSPATAKKYREAIVEVVIRQMYFNGKCRFPYLGNFYVKEIEGYTQKQKNKNGGYSYFDVPAHNKPCFEPADSFVNDINMGGVTKAYRKRLKRNKLTKADIERMARANQLERLKNYRELERQKGIEDFQEKLRQKKEENIDETE